MIIVITSIVFIIIILNFVVALIKFSYTSFTILLIIIINKEVVIKYSVNHLYLIIYISTNKFIKSNNFKEVIIKFIFG